MADVKGVVDDIGCIKAFVKEEFENEFYIQFLEALAELEDNNNHISRHYPISRFHKMEGTGKYQIFRFDIDKKTMWRCFAQYGKDNRLHLCGICGPVYHDKPMEFVKTHKDYFEL